MIKISETTLQIEIVQAMVSDINDLVSCINTGIHYPPYWTSSELQWWFFEYPHPVVIYRAVYKNETIGTFAVFKRKLTNNLTCGVLMGLVIKKEWRNKGLFRSLGKAAMKHFKDIDLFFCFPNNIGAKALEKNFNFKIASRIDTLILEKIDFSKKDIKPYSIQKIVPNTKFINHRGHNKYLLFRNDKKFRSWRYGLNPLFSYYQIGNKTNDFSIIKIFHNKEEGKKFGDIVDFEMSEMNKENIRDLLTTGCSALFSLGVEAITIKALPGNIIFNVAKKMGFIDSGKSHYFCIKNKTNLSFVSKPQTWIIRWGDFMRR